MSNREDYDFDELEDDDDSYFDDYHPHDHNEMAFILGICAIIAAAIILFG